MRLISLGTVVVFVLWGNLVMAADWPQFLGNNAHTGKSVETLEPPLAVKWSFSGDDKFISSPSVKGGKVYIGSRDNSLYALNELDGSLQWTYSARDWIDSTPFITDTKVYFASKDGYVYCLNNADGALVWQFKTGGTNSSSPIVGEGVVFVGSGFPDKKIYALNADTGDKFWETETGQMVYSSGAVAGNNLYTGSNDGKVYSLNKDTGKVNWAFKTNGGIYYASPSILDGKLFLAAGDFDWAVNAVNTSDGQLVWSFTPDEAEPTPTYVSNVVIGTDDVYVVSGYSAQYLYALSAATGALRWKAPLGPATRFGFSSTPVVTDDTVYVATSSGTLKSFESATGTETWSYDLGADILSSAVIANETLFVATFDGTLYAFEGI